MSGYDLKPRCMSAGLLITIMLGYFLLLVVIARFTSGEGGNAAFFKANGKAPWAIVAFGMIGTSLSGVTFISVPGWVTDTGFGYMQVVLGYLVGYWLIAGVLLPLYYRSGITSIYQVLERRIGPAAYKTGAVFFFISRVLGAAFRLYLVCMVLHEFALKEMGIPFAATVGLSIAFIWIYTYRGGMKTIIWTDTLQTLFMLSAVGITLTVVMGELDMGLGALWNEAKQMGLTSFGQWDEPLKADHFWKQFLGGALIALTMTGMDQDMMQKNLSCRSLGDSQKNVLAFSTVLVGVNMVFLLFGAALLVFAGQAHISLPAETDQIYPQLALSGSLGMAAAVLFVLGLTAAAYSSADSALTALTTSFYVDILGFPEEDSKKNRVKRQWVHVLISVVLLLVILVFSILKDQSVIHNLLVVAGYTYGPILGMFVFSLIWRNRQVADRMVPVFAIVAPLATYFIKTNSENWFGGYVFGYELLAVNGLLMLGMMLLGSRKEKNA